MTQTERIIHLWGKRKGIPTAACEKFFDKFEEEVGVAASVEVTVRVCECIQHKIESSKRNVVASF